MKGVILAGGTGSRLFPLTKVTNKHLLPVFDKPMIFYPLLTLINAGIKDIMIVTGGESIGDFMKLLGSGLEWGAKFTYRCQEGAGGIPVALGLAKEFVGNDKFVAILGDNIMEDSIKDEVEKFDKGNKSAKIFLKKVPDPERFGLAEVKDGKIVATYEKPEKPVTDLAILGIYFLDYKAFDVIPNLKPSGRGELEITEVLDYYIKNNDMDHAITDSFWIDAGTFGSLHTAHNFAASKTLYEKKTTELKNVIPIFRPSWSDEEIKNVTEVLKSGWWGAGPKTNEFEEKFSKFIGMDHGIALSSASAALHLAGKLLDLPEKSEVIIPAITFVSTAYIANLNNCDPVFCDVEEDTMNINPNDLKKKITSKTKCVVIVHYGGHACDIDAIKEVIKDAEKQYGHKIYLVEDCAHATGGTYKGKKLGSFGDISCFSFQAVKNLATGDGGMLLTNDADVAKRARVLRWVGITKETADRTDRDQYKWEYEIVEPGYKYQMNDLSAAIGLAQLKRLDDLNGARRKITEIYNNEFKSLTWIKTPPMNSYTDSANHNYCIKLPSQRIRDELMNFLKDENISTTVHYKPLYLHKVFKDIKADCPVADKLWNIITLLPIFPDMSASEINRVISTVKAFDYEHAK